MVPFQDGMRRDKRRMCVCVCVCVVLARHLEVVDRRGVDDDSLWLLKRGEGTGAEIGGLYTYSKIQKSPARWIRWKYNRRDDKSLVLSKVFMIQGHNAKRGRVK